MLLNILNNIVISNFIYDMLIVPQTFEEHLISLSNLLNRLAEVGLAACPIKCQLAFSDLHFLGHSVAQRYLSPGAKNMDKQKNASRPQTKKDVRSFVLI